VIPAPFARPVHVCAPRAVPPPGAKPDRPAAVVAMACGAHGAAGPSGQACVDKYTAAVDVCTKCSTRTATLCLHQQTRVVFWSAFASSIKARWPALTPHPTSWMCLPGHVAPVRLPWHPLLCTLRFTSPPRADLQEAVHS
jgi:hypothetical protein